MQPIKTSHGIAILGTCFLITLLFINWAGRQIDSYVLSVPISPSSQMAAISGSGSGLVAHYTFDDGTASDSSGNGNNGTVNGATAVVGKVGSGAMSFDGVDDSVSMGNTADQTTNDFSVSFWAKDTSNIGHILEHIVGKASENASIVSPGWKIEFNSNALRVSAHDGVD